jgi:hypothetical protein
VTKRRSDTRRKRAHTQRHRRPLPTPFAPPLEGGIGPAKIEIGATATKSSAEEGNRTLPSLLKTIGRSAVQTRRNGQEAPHDAVTGQRYWPSIGPARPNATRCGLSTRPVKDARVREGAHPRAKRPDLDGHRTRKDARLVGMSPHEIDPIPMALSAHQGSGRPPPFRRSLSGGGAVEAATSGDVPTMLRA